MARNAVSPRNIERSATRFDEEEIDPDAAGDAITDAAISEPDTNSDVSSVAGTRGDRREQDVDRQRFGRRLLVVVCRTDDADDRCSGFSQIVESDWDGFEADRIPGKLGIRASDTAELILDGVRVPDTPRASRSTSST